MPWKRTQNGPPARLRLPAHPLPTFVIIMATIFVVEAVVMLVLPLLGSANWHPAAAMVADASMLVIVLCPLIWLLTVRPIRALAHARGQLLLAQSDALETERRRLSRELHDGLGQLQTAILLTTSAAMQAQSQEAMRERVSTAHQLATSAIETTKRLAQGLSPDVLERFGLGIAVARMAEECSRHTSTKVEYANTIGDTRFSPAIELCVFRVLQEATNNALRHADAGQISLRTSLEAGTLSFEVTDDGRGPSLPGQIGGAGLANMKDRVHTLGGKIDFRPVRGRGFRVHGALPAEIIHRD